MVMALLTLSAMVLSAEVRSGARIKTSEAACEWVKARVSASRHFPKSAIAYCDTIPVNRSPKSVYVLQLHSKRECEGICSSSMGWYAVQKTTGRVFEWNVADWRLASPVGPKR